MPVNHFTEVTAAIDVLLTQTQKATAKRSRYTLAQLLAQMPDAEQYKAFVNSDEVLRAWDEMISVGREFGAANTNRWDAIFAATSHRPLQPFAPSRLNGCSTAQSRLFGLYKTRGNSLRASVHPEHPAIGEAQKDKNRYP